MPAPREPLREGLVIANYGATLIVEDAHGGIHPCVVRKKAGAVVCGDRVLWQPDGHGHGIVSRVQARRSLLARPDRRGRLRPLCANIDQLVVVGAPEAPARPGRGALDRTVLNTRLIDHYLAAAEILGIAAVVAINKIDLADEALLARLAEETAPYRALGYDVFHVSATRHQGLDELHDRLRGHTSVLVGESGVGKSSLVQRLLPDQPVRVGALSAASGKGRHTTTTATLFHLPGGGDIIDSPGVREFRLWPVPPAELARGFREFREFLGHCRYRDCHHDGEPGCAIAAAATGEDARIHPRRLHSYRAILHALKEETG